MISLIFNWSFSLHVFTRMSTFNYEKKNHLVEKILISELQVIPIINTSWYALFIRFSVIFIIGENILY